MCCSWQMGGMRRAHASSSASMRSEGSAHTASSSSTSASAGGSCRRQPDLLLYFIAAVVRSQRRKVLDEAHDADDIVRLFHGVRIDLWCLPPPAFSPPVEAPWDHLDRRAPLSRINGVLCPSRFDSKHNACLGFFACQVYSST
jgi:hypothetical protein